MEYRNKQEADSLFVQLEDEVKKWKEFNFPLPKITVITGSGISLSLPNKVSELPLEHIIPFPVYPLEGHTYSIEIYNVEGVTTLVQRGRFHLYQGYHPHEIVFPIRFWIMIGAKIVLLTNSAGALSDRFEVGEIVTIEDQINLTAHNPLIGSLPKKWASRFLDVSDLYSKELIETLKGVYTKVGLTFKTGTYVGVQGPSYETPAETRFLASIGGELVGMSTVLEALAAHHMGGKVAGLSIVTNSAISPKKQSLSHHEVVINAQRGNENLSKIVRTFISSLVNRYPELREDVH